MIKKKYSECIHVVNKPMDTTSLSDVDLVTNDIVRETTMIRYLILTLTV